MTAETGVKDPVGKVRRFLEEWGYTGSIHTSAETIFTVEDASRSVCTEGIIKHHSLFREVPMRVKRNSVRHRAGMKRTRRFSLLLTSLLPTGCLFCCSCGRSAAGRPWLGEGAAS